MSKRKRQQQGDQASPDAAPETGSPASDELGGDTLPAEPIDAGEGSLAPADPLEPDPLDPEPEGDPAPEAAQDGPDEPPGDAEPPEPEDAAEGDPDAALGAEDDFEPPGSGDILEPRQPTLQELARQWQEEQRAKATPPEPEAKPATRATVSEWREKVSRLQTETTPPPSALPETAPGHVWCKALSNVIHAGAHHEAGAVISVPTELFVARPDLFGPHKP